MYLPGTPIPATAAFLLVLLRARLEILIADLGPRLVLLVLVPTLTLSACCMCRCRRKCSTVPWLLSAAGYPPQDGRCVIVAASHRIPRSGSALGAAPLAEQGSAAGTPLRCKRAGGSQGGGGSVYRLRRCTSACKHRMIFRLVRGLTAVTISNVSQRLSQFRFQQELPTRC